MLLYHFTKREKVSKIMLEGLIPISKYEMFTELRNNVVFCWLSPDDQKIFTEDDICLEVSTDTENCRVAEMDYISLAMMYKYGGQKYGGANIPVNEEASKLFVKLYEVTAMPIDRYEKGNFFTPEVLVKGRIKPENIRVLDVSKMSSNKTGG